MLEKSFTFESLLLRYLEQEIQAKKLIVLFELQLIIKTANYRAKKCKSSTQICPSKFESLLLRYLKQEIQAKKVIIFHELQLIIKKMQIIEQRNASNRPKNVSYLPQNCKSVTKRNIKSLTKRYNSYIYNWSLHPFNQNYWPSFYINGNYESLPEICWENIAKEILFLYFVLMSGLGLEPWLYV